MATGRHQSDAGRMTSAILAAAVMAACADRASAVITLDANFDHGSLASYSLTNGTTATPTVNLTGRTNYFGAWRWMNFKASGTLNSRPTFRVNQAFGGGNAALNGHSMVYSVDDGQTWNFFDNNARSSNVYTFSNTFAFASDNVQVAFAYPYSYGMSVAHTKQVLDSPYASPTVSGDATGVIGMSPGGVDDLGRVVAPREIYAYRITNPDVPSTTARPKKKVVIGTGMHANETLGTHTYQGLVDFLISDDPRASVLRSVADFYCYPTLNPDGRFAGNNRSTVQNVNQDPNGRWNPSLWGPHADIRENGEAMIADVAAAPGAVEAFIDFHSTIPAYPGDDFGYIEYEQGDNLAPFWLNFQARQPNVLTDDSTGTSWTSANFAEAFLGAKVDITFETQFGFERPKSFYTTMGRNLGMAFADAFLPTPGDSDFDGDVDFTDLLTLARNYDTPSGATWDEGDFTLDADVDFSDLLELAKHYGTTSLSVAEAAELSGAFQADWALAQALVPEPTVAITGLAAMGMGLRRRRS